ncbi:MAG: AEC family transporter [Alphaproteobacteria bacterium]|nr:AEC family transporter [Alphaproteobacteria bacterium]
MIAFNLIGIVLPVFACSALGYVWAKTGRSFDSETVTSLVVSIGTPCLVFDTLTRLDLTIQSFGVMAGATATAIGIFGAIALIYLWAAKLDRQTYLPALMFPNCGNMGLPVCLFAFGESGLALAISYFATMIVLQFTVGVAIAAGRVSFRMVLTSPMVYAVAAALVMITFDLNLPKPVAETIHLLGGFTIPIMLMALGVSLAKLRISSIGDSLAVGASRLALGFGVGTAVAWMFGLDPMQAGVLIVQCSMPIAVFSYLFALRYGRSPESLAGAVVLSTLLAFVFLPVVLYLVLPN